MAVTLTPVPMIEIAGAKVWVDESNVHNVRPGSITVELLADGEVVSSSPTWTKKSGDRWTFTFTVPAETYADTGLLTLSFYFPDAREPGNGDPRLLAAAFRSLVLEEMR